MTLRFTTIGHSNRTLDQFLDILRAAGADMVADVRSFPRSRTNPAFNTDRLPGDLERMQIGYRHLASLGGRRGAQADVDPRQNALWRVRSFHNYADHALGPEFAEGLAELVALGQGRLPAIMCSEAVWWRCHRRIIADHLLARGHRVDHLMGAGRIEAACMTPGAQVTEEGKVIYPAT